MSEILAPGGTPAGAAPQHAPETLPKTLYEAYDCAALTRPEALLLVWTEAGLERISLPDCLDQGRQVAEGLRRLGVGKGHVIATQLPQSLELIVVEVAAARLGAIVLTVVPTFGANELGYILRESGAKAFVSRTHWRKADVRQRLIDCGDLPALAAHVICRAEAPAGTIAWSSLLGPTTSDAPYAEAAPDDVSFLLYTSGTTADPKGVQHTHRSLLAEIRSTEALLGPHAQGVAMSPWPTGHIAGALTNLRFLALGRTTICMEHWEASACADLLQLLGATYGSGTPYHLTGLLDAADAAGHSLATLKAFQTGAAPVPPSLVARCAARGLATFRAYGSTEHPTSTFGSPDDPLEKRLTTEGRVVPGVELRFLDDDGQDMAAGEDGEIVTRGPDMFAGYTKAELNEAALLPGHWCRSGDVGHLDAEGYLVLTDRKKDIIIRGGENISSREVEDHLHAHPAVAEAAAVAAPDARMGEIVCAFVVTRPGQDIDIAEVDRWFGARGLARHKTPERLELIDALPRNATGKVLKHELRRRLRGL